MGELGSIHVVPAGRPEADLLAVGCFEGEAPAVDGLEEANRQAVGRLASRPGWRGKEDHLAQTEAGPRGRWSRSTASAPARISPMPGSAAGSAGAAEDARQSGARRMTAVLPVHAETSGPPPAACCAPWRWRPTASTASSATARRRTASSGSPWCRRRRGGGLPGRAARAWRRWPPRSSTPATSPTRRPTRPPPPGWRSAPASSPAGRNLDDRPCCAADELRARGMGGLLAVGAGSAHEPRMIRAALRGAAARASPWWARGSPSTPAASRSSPPPTWTR